jgi:hypothetical protein
VYKEKTKGFYRVSERRYLNFSSCTFVENFGYTYRSDRILRYQSGIYINAMMQSLVSYITDDYSIRCGTAQSVLDLGPRTRRDSLNCLLGGLLHKIPQWSTTVYV